MPAKLKTVPDRWVQQIHRGCGGWLIVVAAPATNDVAIACRQCKVSWKINHPYVPGSELKRDAEFGDFNEPSK